MDCTFPPDVHLLRALFHYHEVHILGICYAHDRGNRGTTTPNCCHLRGCWYGHDLCGEQSIHVGLNVVN